MGAKTDSSGWTPWVGAAPTIAPIGAFLYELRVTRSERRTAASGWIVGFQLDERRTAYDERFVKGCQ